MTIQRMEHVGIVVDDLGTATAFFVELGLKLQGEWPVEGDWVDRVVGLEGVRAESAMLETPDGHGRLELVKFHVPSGRAATGTRRRTPRASATSHSRSTTLTPSSLACEPAARSSLARWSATKTAIGSRIIRGNPRSASSTERATDAPGLDGRDHLGAAIAGLTHGDLAAMVR
jgi:catechol 2,3-dioxygenase-like lactoylglutathione lyase family enzyme